MRVSVLQGLGEEMDYSQGLPTPMGYFGQDATPKAVTPNLPLKPVNIPALLWVPTAAVQVGIAYLLLSNALNKWKDGWEIVGYVAGGMFALGAVRSIGCGL